MQADAFEIDQLEPILVRFTHLQRLTFRYHAQFDFRRPKLEVEVKERIAHALPTLYERHALHWDGDALDFSPMERCTPLLKRSESYMRIMYGVHSILSTTPDLQPKSGFKLKIPHTRACASRKHEPTDRISRW